MNERASDFRASLGPVALDDGSWKLRVWAPRAERVEVLVQEPHVRLHPMERERRGYWSAVLGDLAAGALYRYRLNGTVERPDPASRHQPRGVHGPSRLEDPSFTWRATEWRGLPLEDHILYELHVGTFSPEGTFDGVVERLDHLERLGVTAVELMPVAQFPGERNWGYDGVQPFAPQASYGGPQGLKRLVDACHERGMAVVLDVVYNHLGPEGCYLDDFGPYFTDRFKTPWGRALNFDGPYCDEVRRYFIENALHWISEFRIDGLRLDAIHGIVDGSAIPFLEELTTAVHAEAARQGRIAHVFAENDRNDPRILQSPELGGHGMDGLWNDDFHHALHALLTGERRGYYSDFGSLRHLEKAMRDGFAIAGDYSAFRRRRHGRPADEVEPHRMVVFSQNHDQVGNRAHGERLAELIGLEKLKLAAACTLLSPYLPLLFMGEEYGELAPFLYFVHHSDPDLVEAVRQGRQHEFASFDWPEQVPDPQSPETFASSRLDHSRGTDGWHRALFFFYRELIACRRRFRGLRRAGRDTFDVRSSPGQHLLTLEVPDEKGKLFLFLHFGDQPRAPALTPDPGRWTTVLDSSAERFGGPGGTLPAGLECDGEGLAHPLQPWSAVLLRAAEPDHIPVEVR